MSDNIQVAAVISVTDEASAAVRGVEQTFQGMARTAQNVGQNIRNALSQQTFKGLGTNFSNLGSAFSNLGRTLGNIVRPVATLIGITGGISLAAATKEMQDWASAAARLPREAEKLGLAVDELQKLRYAASRFGVDSEQFDNAIVMLNRNLTLAAEGKLPRFAWILDQIDKTIIPRWKSGQITIREVFDLLAQSTAKQETAQDKLMITQNAFGRGMDDLVPVLAEGAKGLEELGNQFEATGQKIKPDDIEKAQAYRRAQQDLGDALRGLATQVFPQLLPAITEMTQAIAAFFQDPERRNAFVTGLVAAFNAFVNVLRTIPWADLITKFGELLTWLTQTDAGATTAKNALLAFAGVKLLPLGLQFYSLGKALIDVTSGVGGLVAALGAGGPALLLGGVALAALAVTGLALYKFWPQIAPVVKETVDNVSTYLGDLGRGVKQFVDDLIADPKGTIKREWDKLQKDLSKAWGDLEKDADKALGWLNKLTGGLIPPTVKENWDLLQQELAAAWKAIEGLVNPVLGALNRLTGGLVPPDVETAWGKISDYFKNTFWPDVLATWRKWMDELEPYITKLKGWADWIATSWLGKAAGALTQPLTMPEGARVLSGQEAKDAQELLKLYEQSQKAAGGLFSRAPPKQTFQEWHTAFQAAQQATGQAAASTAESLRLYNEQMQKLSRGAARPTFAEWYKTTGAAIPPEPGAAPPGVPTGLIAPPGMALPGAVAPADMPGIVAAQLPAIAQQMRAAIPQGEVRVRVDVVAPPGTSAEASATGTGITLEPVNIGLSTAGAL